MNISLQMLRMEESRLHVSVVAAISTDLIPLALLSPEAFVGGTGEYGAYCLPRQPSGHNYSSRETLIGTSKPDFF